MKKYSQSTFFVFVSHKSQLHICIVDEGQEVI